MRICAALPLGDRLYKRIQKQFGRLRVNPMSRLTVQVEMMRWLLNEKFFAEGKTVLEVGTGHMPIIPIGFFLSGAAQIITIDLHRRIDWELTRDSLAWIAGHRSEVRSLYADTVPAQLFEEQFALLTKWHKKPKKFLEAANIEYLAPADAVHTNLPAQSVDCHFSVAVLEHIPLATLAGIFTEARRILKPTGYAVHFFDLSDHFQHQDKSISSINFLQYSDAEWNRIAGNEFMYCNRLRNSDYLNLFADLSFQPLRWERYVDTKSLDCLQKDFVVHSQFQTYAAEDLCTTTVHAMLRP